MGQRKRSSRSWTALQQHFPLLNIKIRHPWPAQNSPSSSDTIQALDRKGDPRSKTFRDTEEYPCSGGFPTLPAEILHEVISYLPPRTQVCLSLTCRFLYNFISPAVNFRSLSFEERIECFFDLAVDSQSRYFVSTTFYCTDCKQICRTSTFKASRNIRAGTRDESERLARVFLHIRNVNPVRRTPSAQVPSASSLDLADCSHDLKSLKSSQFALTSDNGPARPNEADPIEPIVLTMCLRYPYAVNRKTTLAAEDDASFMACLHCSRFYCHYDSFAPEDWSYVHYPAWFQYTGPRSWKLYNSSWTMRQEPHGNSAFFEAKRVRLHKTRAKIPCDYGMGAVVSGGKELALGFKSEKWTLLGRATKWFEKKIAFNNFYESALASLRQEAALKGDRNNALWCGGEPVSLNVYLFGCSPARDIFQVPWPH